MGETSTWQREEYPLRRIQDEGCRIGTLRDKDIYVNYMDLCEGVLDAQRLKGQWERVLGTVS